MPRIRNRTRTARTEPVPAKGTVGTDKGAAKQKLPYLHTRHPIYDANVAVWLKNERRLRGGRDVIAELTPFDWEKNRDPTSHYVSRQQQAVYLNFPDRFASALVGHMMRQSPEPGTNLNFGTLGDVRRDASGKAPTPAEMIYYNADGIGLDGSQWNNYWTDVAKRACATGHRWILVEGPQQKPQTKQDEIDGMRPHLSDYSPISVVNWHYDYGRLSFAIIKRAVRKMELDSNNTLLGNSAYLETVLLVRQGCQIFGSQYAGGGWWVYDNNDELEDSGTWAVTDGDIPMVPLYYERMKIDPVPSHSMVMASLPVGIGERTAQPDPVMPIIRVTPAISRSGTDELGNAAVAYMNLASAADFDAFDGASSVQALANVDEKGFNLFIGMVNGGNRYAPLQGSDDSKNAPHIIDASTGTVVADVFDRRLKAKREEALELMLNEMHAAPYASGESKKVTFTDGKAPRLAVFAQEIETAQNAVIYFLEKLWGNKVPTGSVEWPKQFDLLDTLQAVTDYFELESLSGITSETAGAAAMMMGARKVGILNDDEDAKAIEDEYLASAKLKTVTGAAQAQVKMRDQAGLVVTAAGGNAAAAFAPPGAQGGTSGGGGGGTA